MTDMCDWRGVYGPKERNFVEHMRDCYPRTTRYLCLVLTLLLIVQVLDFLSERGWF
jgi:hypothetical protein